jgi:hypothetical protein
MSKNNFKFEGLVKQAEQQNKESINFIRSNIVINEELKAFIPPLSDSEYKILEDNILKDGCRDAIILWEQPEGLFIIVDGHNRYQICHKHNLLFKVQIVQFENMDSVKEWMINNQLGKRNATNTLKAYQRGSLYSLMKKKREGTARNEFNKHEFDKDTERTVELVASMTNVSASTIQRDYRLYQSLEVIGLYHVVLKNDILSENVSISNTILWDIYKIHEEEALQINFTSVCSVADLLKLHTTWRSYVDALKRPNPQQKDQNFWKKQTQAEKQKIANSKDEKFSTAIELISKYNKDLSWEILNKDISIRKEDLYKLVDCAEQIVFEKGNFENIEALKYLISVLPTKSSQNDYTKKENEIESVKRLLDNLSFKEITEVMTNYLPSSQYDYKEEYYSLLKRVTEERADFEKKIDTLQKKLTNLEQNQKKEPFSDYQQSFTIANRLKLLKKDLIVLRVESNKSKHIVKTFKDDVSWEVFLSFESKKALEEEVIKLQNEPNVIFES